MPEEQFWSPQRSKQWYSDPNLGSWSCSWAEGLLSVPGWIKPDSEDYTVSSYPSQMQHLASTSRTLLPRLLSSLFKINPLPSLSPMYSKDQSRPSSRQFWLNTSYQGKTKLPLLQLHKNASGSYKSSNKKTSALNCLIDRLLSLPIKYNQNSSIF